MDTGSYKRITASGLVYSGATQIYSVTLDAPSADSTLVLYDWSSAVGTAFISLSAASKTSTSKSWEPPLGIKTALYAVLAGSGASVSIEADGSFTTSSTSTSSSTTTTSTSTTTTSTSTTTTSTSTTTTSTSVTTTSTSTTTPEP